MANATGLTRAGARRILLTLQGLGYVSMQGRQFRLTAKVLDLGFAYLTSLPMWALAEPVLQTLSHVSSHRSRMSPTKMKRELLPALLQSAQRISLAIRAASR